MKRFFDFIFLMRPTLWIPVWTFFLLGFHRSGGEVSLLYFTTAFILYTILMSGVYVLNQIIDIESDRVNKKLFLLSDGHIKIVYAWIEVVILFILAWLLAIPYSFQFKLILLFSMILGILYSLPPFKFKGRPIFDLLSNAIGYGVIAFSLGWVTGVPFSRSTLIYSLPYFFAVGAVFINTTIPDIKGDEQANEITTGLFLGEKTSYWLSTAFIIIAFGLSVYLNDWICRIASAWAMPLFLWAAIRQNLKTCLISIRVGAPILAILMGLIFWWFIPLLLIIFIAQRIYYKLRFNIIYPKIV